MGRKAQGKEKYRNNPNSEDELRTTMFREAPTGTIAMDREICRIEVGTVSIRQDNLSEKQITDGGASLKKLKIRGNIFFLLGGCGTGFGEHD